MYGCICTDYKEEKTEHACKEKKHVHKVFGSSSGFLWFLKYRVNLKGTPCEKVQEQKHNAFLLILSLAAYILQRHSSVLFRKHLTTCSEVYAHNALN